MLLILTNSRDATADYLTTLLSDSHLPFIRIDTDSFVDRVKLSYAPGVAAMEFDERVFSSTDIEHLWYRRPQRLAESKRDPLPEERYAFLEWEAALEGFLAHIPMARWMNHPACIALASHKLEQISAARQLGFAVPDTIVTQDPSRLRAFFRRYDGRIIAKPMAGGYVERVDGEEDSVIFTNRVAESDLARLDDLQECPTLFQEQIENGRDVRITVVDDAIHAVYLAPPSTNGSGVCDIRRDNMTGVSYSPARLPAEVERQVRLLMDHYHLRFAAIDMMVSDSGVWYYLEINPNGQWAWLDLVGATEIGKSFARSFRPIC